MINLLKDYKENKKKYLYSLRKLEQKELYKIFKNI